VEWETLCFLLYLSFLRYGGIPKCHTLQQPNVAESDVVGFGKTPGALISRKTPQADDHIGLLHLLYMRMHGELGTAAVERN
jgi:hypothetical protein